MKHNFSEGGPSALAEELAALQNLDIGVLKQRWRALYQTEPPARISRCLLLQAVAYQLQAQSLGGLKSSTRRLLERLEQERNTRSPAKEPPTRLSPGSVLMREWHGISHAVTVLENGVLFRRTRYRSPVQP